jgi:hypothetical protein
MSDDYEDYNDYSSNDGITEDTSGAEPADYSSNDGISPEMAATVMESLGMTGVNLDKWSWEGAAPAGANPGAQPTTGDFARADRALSANQSQDTSMASKFGSFLSGASDFLGKYKTPLEMVGRGIQTAMKNKQDEKVAQNLSDSRIRELNQADLIKQNANARYSASVSGLRAPTGLINQVPLHRVDGSQVFGANGQLVKA